MVRTQSRPTPVSIDSSRVLAYSAAIALHAIAAGLLLVPLSYAPAPHADDAQTQVRWVEPKIVPVTPPPPPLEVTATAPPRNPPALPQAITPPPMPVFATQAVLHLPSAQITEPVTTTSVTAPPSEPATGAQLRYVHAPAPAYPRQALMDGAQGTVLLKVLVDETGKPVEVRVERSSGNRALDTAARTQVLRQWRFQPATEAGVPVQAIGLVPVSFNLQ